MNLAASILLLTGLLATPVLAGDWPQWRGPARNGQFSGPSWPTKLDTNHLQKTWEVKLGPSYSGPVVTGQRVFTTETRDKKLEVVRAFDRQSGKALWQVEWPGALSVPFFAKANGDWIRATPACDGDSLFVAGIRDVLVCLDVRDGRERWRVDFVKEFDAPLPDFGFVSSPALDETAVYVQAGASLVKVAKRDGKVLWRTLKDGGGMWGSVFSSPTFATFHGQRQLVVQTRAKLAGVNPDTGDVLWEQPVEAFRGMNILTPVAHDDMLFTSTYGGKTIGFKVSRSNDRYSVSQVWQHKAQGYMTTPVVVGGVAYTHLKSQRAMAIEVATGKELWTSSESFGKYWSLVANGDRILALDQRGVLLSLRANPAKLELLDQRKLTAAETWAHLAVADDQLFVRELNALSVWQWRSESAPLK
jgi:outer membrane protein assembly factor BamB